MPLQASLFVGHRFNTTVFQAVLMEQFQWLHHWWFSHSV
jgi:hypothetical protein